MEKLRELISAEEIQGMVARMARKIEAVYRDKDAKNEDPLLCIGILKGSVFFLTDLLKQITLPLQVDFLQASSYNNGPDPTVPGEIKILKDIDLPVRGRDVLLIEDIVDTGYTLATVLGLMRFKGAKSVRLAALLDKPSRRVPGIEINIDFLGRAIEDTFVVGYGLDINERHRNLPYIAEVISA